MAVAEKLLTPGKKTE